MKPLTALSQLNDRELRLIFLHEMAHVRRKDVDRKSAVRGAKSSSAERKIKAEIKTEKRHLFDALLWAAKSGKIRVVELLPHAVQRNVPDDPP
jgi:Zn-dependent protease with chaperone function